MAVEEWKKKGVIDETDDENYNSSIITAPKKDNEVISSVARRVCVDLSRINDLLEDDANDISIVEDVFEHIGGSVYYSVIDLEAANLQVLFDKDSRKYTSFTYKNVRYQFTIAN